MRPHHEPCPARGGVPYVLGATKQSRSLRGRELQGVSGPAVRRGDARTMEEGFADDDPRSRAACEEE